MHGSKFRKYYSALLYNFLYYVYSYVYFGIVKTHVFMTTQSKICAVYSLWLTVICLLQSQHLQPLTF